MFYVPISIFLIAESEIIIIIIMRGVEVWQKYCKLPQK